MLVFINIIEDEHIVWVSKENTVGEEYPYSDVNDIKDAVNDYIDKNVSLYVSEEESV